MRQFNAAPLELKKQFKESFQTHPFEAGWASEAIFFIMVEDVSGSNSQLLAEVEISHDGFNWAYEGSVVGPIYEKGLNFIKVSCFGNWLRLNCKIEGDNPGFKLLVQLALKE